MVANSLLTRVHQTQHHFHSAAIQSVSAHFHNGEHTIQRK